MSDTRVAWLARPVDIHYRPELAELGVRATSALEEEQSRGPVAQIEISRRGITVDEVRAIVQQCKDDGRWPRAYCSYDDGVHNPPWLKAGDQYYWYDLPGGHLVMSGLSIPLTERWILCPAHSYIVQEGM